MTIKLNVMKGRSKELIELRDIKLIERYYYWTEVRRLRFDDTIKLLSREEFFISEDRIMTIIRKTNRETSCQKPKTVVKNPNLTTKQLQLLFKD